VDAVGSCVGLRGIRIQNIVNELHGEKIDVVEWSRDPTRFIKNSLSPALVMKVQVEQEEGTATAVVPERQLSLAIGKEGQNARLAAKLTGLKIDIISDVEATELEAERAKLAAQKAAEEAARPAPEPEPVVVQEEEPAAVGEPMAVPTVEEGEVEILEPAAIVPDEILPAAEVSEPVVAEAELVQAVADTPEVDVPEVVETGEYVEPEIPEELFFEEEPEPVPVAEEATPLHDLPDDIWNISAGVSGDSGVIRFAEDIEELAARGPRGGGGRRRRGGGGGNRRRGPARRR
jgi:N utilization substance protein A